MEGSIISLITQVKKSKMDKTTSGSIVAVFISD